MLYEVITYSGTQAVKTLKELGYRVVLINSNPATIMTDPEFADRTYVEPIKPEVIAQIIKDEKVDAILPTMGGQTALNAAMKMYEQGMLEGIKFLGANPEAIKKGEDRQAFKEAMIKIGMDLPHSRYVITSYSIHYTKLYEHPTRQSKPSRFARKAVPSHRGVRVMLQPNAIAMRHHVPPPVLHPAGIATAAGNHPGSVRELQVVTTAKIV